MFTDMKEGTAEDWAHIAAEHGKHQVSAAPKQIMEGLARLDSIEVGFAASQLTHCLMAGTLARRSGRAREAVGGALPDLGKIFSIPNHGPIAANAEALRLPRKSNTPLLAPEVQDVLFRHLGKDRRARALQGETWFAFAERS